MAFLSVFFFAVWGEYFACAAKLSPYVNTTRAPCLILMCMGYVSSLLFLSESATRGISEISKQFQPDWKKKLFSVLLFDLSSSGSALFLNGAAMVLGVDAGMGILMWVHIAAFLFFCVLWVTSHGTFHGYRINYSWVPWGNGSRFMFQCQHSSLCPDGVHGVARGRSAERSGLSLRGQGFLLGKQTSLRLLPWLKSWYCDTFRCS